MEMNMSVKANSDAAMFAAITPIGQPVAQPILYPVMVANTGSVGVPMMWPVGQIPQGAFVYAADSNSFACNAIVQPSACFVPSSEYGVNDSNRLYPRPKKESDDPFQSQSRGHGRPASMNEDALTSEEIDELRLAVQRTVRRLQNPNSSECRESPYLQDSTDFARAGYTHTPQERDNEMLSSTSSTCTPDADEDSNLVFVHGAGKKRGDQRILDKDVDHMLAELESSNLDRRQTAVEWVISSLRVLAFTRRGCRIVQRAMELAVWEDQERLVENLQGLVLEAMESPHANYVVQKCFEIMPPNKLQFVLSELKGQGIAVARHRFGCRVLQRVLEHCPPDQSKELIAEVLDNVPQLARHTYGNFVIQHILQHGTSYQVHQIADVLLDDAIRFASHRIASHVMSCALSCCSLEDVQNLTQVLLNEKDHLTDRHYGSFVIREANRINSRLHDVAIN
jgi:hypothetical protein